MLKPQAYPALVLHQPRLWWPVTYGDQPLYRLTVEARVDGQTSSQVTRRFGVRTVGSVILPSGGRAFTVNGRTIRMTGGAWVPDYLMSWSAQTLSRRGPPDGRRQPYDRARQWLRDRAARCVLRRLRPVRSARVAGPLPHLRIEQLPERRDHGLEPAPLRPGHLSGQHEGLHHPAARASEHVAVVRQQRSGPAGRYGPGVAERDPSGAGRYAALVARFARGAALRKEDLHTTTGGPYWLVPLPEYFRIYAQQPTATCRNEIGLLSPPPINSIVKAIPDYDQPEPAWFPWNRDLGYHDALDYTSRESDKIIRRDLGEPACLTEYLWMSDLYSYLAYQAIYEAANKVRPRNAGTHIWKINAAWPSVVQQVFDWRLRPNGGYYGMRSACRPLHVQHSVDDHTIQVVSTLAEPRPGLKVRATLVDTAGRVEHTRRYAVAAAADATTRVGALPELVKDGRLHFLALDLLDAEGRELDRVVAGVEANCRFHDLMKLPPAEIDARVSERSERAGETLYRVSVRNGSSVPAAQVWLEVIGGDQGDEVLPAFWSDNALTLLPGECRELTVRFRTALLAARRRT